MNKYWFKPKRYGYGAQPSTWEGWAVTLVFILFIVSRAMKIETDGAATWFIVEAIIAVIIFGYFIKTKTDGEWKWRWGKKAQ